MHDELQRMRRAQEHANRLLAALAAVLAAAVGVAIWALTRH
jgi:ubiquinone biosynthesis protein